MTVTKWTLTNPADSSSHVFYLNPDPTKGGGGEIAFEKTLGEGQIGQNGTIMTFSQDKQMTSQFNLTITTQAEYNTMWAWFYKEAQLTLSDDLGRSSTIYMTNIDAKRVKHPAQPWRHDMSIQYLVLALTDI